MKARTGIALLLAATLAMTGCGTDEATKQVIDNIDAIGDIDTSDIDLIEETQSLYDALTDDQKGKVTNYEALEDAVSQLDDLKKQYAIETDETAPVFEGIEDGEVIEVKAGTAFNLNEYLGERLTITDDVTEGTIEYRTDCESDAYDSITGIFDTQNASECPVTLVATDEAGNEGKLNLTVTVVPIHVTKDDPTPLVYDGEYGTVKVVGFTHDSSYGEPEYHLFLEVENKTDKSIEVALASPYTTINKYQVGASFITNSVPSGTIGKMECLIDDADIPAEVGDFTAIDSKVSFYEVNNADPFYRIPIILDVNVSQ